MEQVIVISAVVLVGFVFAVGGIVWALHFKPKRRRRFELKHQRSKIRPGEVADR